MSVSRIERTETARCGHNDGWARRWIERTNIFWLAVVAALLLLACIQTLTDRPSLLHGWDGLATATLVFAYSGWILYMMRLRWKRRISQDRRLNPRQTYLLVALGVGLTVPLVLLHGEFAATIFFDIGIIAFAIDGWPGAVPVTLLAALWLSVTGVPLSSSIPQIAGDVIAVASTTALVYSLAAVQKQTVERDRLIAELREAHQQLRLSTAREVDLAALRERNRLAREMHDSLGHALVLIAIKIEAAQRLQAVDPYRAAMEWEGTKALVRATMRDLRSSLAGLRPPVLEEQPFSAALRDLAYDLGRRSAICAIVTIPDEADALSREMQETLYRVAQEALANVDKHAKAGRVTLTLDLRGDAALLEVVDDGIGLETAPRSESGGYGVLGMRERVETLGGVLTVGPADAGTVLRARIPFEETARVRHPHPVG